MKRRLNQISRIIVRRGSFIIILILLLGAFGLLRIVATHKDIEDLANTELPLIESLTQIETNQLEQAISFERAVRYAAEYTRNPNAGKLILSRFIIADSVFRVLANQVDNDLMTVEKEIQEVLKQTSEAPQKIKLEGLFFSVKKLEGDHTNYKNHALKVLDLVEQGKFDDAIVAMERVEKEVDQINKQIEGVLMRHEIFTESLTHLVVQKEIFSIKWIVMLTVLFIILTLLAVFLFSYQVWRPLEDIRNSAEKIGNGNLKARVKLRSSSITGDIANVFNTMADKFLESRKEMDQFIHFSYSTALDLKTPITILRSLLDMFDKENMTDANFQAILKNAKKTTGQLDKTVEGLAEVNRVREALAVAEEDLVIEDILKEVVSEFAHEVKSNKAVIKKDFSRCNKIRYPKRQFKLIFEKLLSNSLKYKNPEKPLIIKIQTKSINGYVMISFNDNGLGFDAIKFRKEILNPYVRAHAHVEGSGLGLFIVKIIMDYHKGEIQIESEPKKGATIILRFN